MGRHTYHHLKEDWPVIIGNFSSLAGGVVIHLPDNHPCIAHPEAVSTFPFAEKWNPIDYWESSVGTSDGKTGVIIGNDVWIGEDVKILNGVTIGDGAIIGAHAVVAKDVPPYAVVVGNPARVKRYRFNQSIITKLLQIQWWNWSDGEIRDRIEDFKNIKKFIEKYG